MTFIQEIRQQPAALRALAAAYHGADFEAARQLAAMLREKEYKRYIFTGMGSSYYVGYIACGMLCRAGLDARAFETREYLMNGTRLNDGQTLLVVISQSGESPEVVELLAQLNGDDNLVTVTNYPEHALHRRGAARFLLHAGAEATTASKTYTNTVAAVLFIAELILDPARAFAPRFEKAVLDGAALMEKWIEDPVLPERLADFFHDSEFLCLVGGGASYCTASHAELVVEEAGKMFSSRYLPAQFIHGPIELIDGRFHAIVFDFTEQARAPVDRIFENLISYGGRALVIGNRKPRIESDRLMWIESDVADADYAPLTEVVPIELLINCLGLRRGLKPGVLTRVRK